MNIKVGFTSLNIVCGQFHEMSITNLCASKKLILIFALCYTIQIIRDQTFEMKFLDIQMVSPALKWLPQCTKGIDLKSKLIADWAQK